MLGVGAQKMGPARLGRREVGGHQKRLGLLHPRLADNIKLQGGFRSPTDGCIANRTRLKCGFVSDLHILAEENMRGQAARAFKNVSRLDKCYRKKGRR
jgi:hypothetical protein